MKWINYHHFYYFWVIAQENSVTKAAKRLRLSQSNLSAQLKEFELSLGQQLFERQGQRLILSSSGKLALNYANEIFGLGQEMLDHFENRPIEKKTQILRIGAISGFSKNLQMDFLSPIILDKNIKIIATQGPLGDLIRQLKGHLLDVVIANTGPKGDGGDLCGHLMGKLSVVLVCSPEMKKKAGKQHFPEAFNDLPIYLPTAGSSFRPQWDSWVEQLALRPKILGEVEAMALLRLFSLRTQAYTVVPEIVVSSELREKKLVCVKKLDFFDEVYAITPSRKYPNQLVQILMEKFRNHALRNA